MEVWQKSRTVDPEVRAYVSSLVNAVGGQSTLDDRYAVGDDALAVLNDLLRWLRLYDEKTNRFDVKRCLAEANLVKGDLLEILALWPEEQQENTLKSRLALACLQLLVPLTWPLELAEETTTVNHHRHAPYLLLAQVGYKREILQFEGASILRTAVRVGLPAMATSRQERTKRDEGVIKLLLYFIRNIAVITQPQHLPSQGDENEISRSSTVDAFHNEDIFNLLLTVGSSVGDEFQEQDVIILEILFHLLKGVDAKKLFLDNNQLVAKETNELESLMLKEKTMHKTYNKTAPTRHNRFGTMIWVKRDDLKVSTVTGQTSITNTSTTLQQMDFSKKWNKPKTRGKFTPEFTETSDFGMRVDLTESARKRLCDFTQDFLDSSFNPLFSSLRRAIEREAERVQQIHHRQYFYLISWFLIAESSRRENGHHNGQRREASSEDSTFAYTAAVLDQETFVLLNRHLQRALDEKNWPDLQAILLCFTQILLTVQSMAESNDEEDQEIAENIQNRIFYEETTHDRIVQVLRGYTNQSFAYLDTVTECVHVFVRMLEKYSKQNVDLQIRSKRRARKKKSKQTQLADHGEGLDEDEEDQREAHRAASERKFDFARFSSKFLSQPCVNTFISLLHYYIDLTPSQLKRCHRFIYRLAFKHELAVMLFRVDILQLFHKMIKGPLGLSTEAEGFKEWEQLVQQIFRRCIKWIERQNEGDGWREAAVVEMLFSKIPGTMFYLQNGYDRVAEKKPPRPPAELQIKRSVEEGHEIGIVVSLLLEQGKQDAVEWLKKQLKNAAEERQAWEDEQAARLPPPENTVDDEVSEPNGVLAAPSIFLICDNDERKMTLFKDKYLRLLLSTLGLQRLGTADDVDASWIIPSELNAAKLEDALKQIQKTEFDPPTFDDGKTAVDFIRNKAVGRRGATFSESESSGENGSDGDIDESMFPPNLRGKRRNTSQEPPKKRRRLTRKNESKLTDEQLEEKAKERKKRDREKLSKIKSSLFVTASDDESDEEKDAEFFRLEEERRRKTAGVIHSTLLKEANESTNNKVKGMEEGKTKKSSVLNEEVDASGSDSALDDSSSDNEWFKGNADALDENMDSATDVIPLAEVSVNAGPMKDISKKMSTEDEEDDEDEDPVTKPVPVRRRARAGFILDSDSE